MIRTTSYLIFFLFAIMVGWVIDSGYRSLVSKRWTNAGYFIGPFCPIYGFGGILLLLMVSYISDMPFLVRCVVYFIGMSMVELIGGLFSTHILKVRLWDYSDAPFNILGQVDLLHSFYWLILALIFEGTGWPMIDFLNTRAVELAQWLDIGIFTLAIGLMIAALVRKMVKERSRVKPFISEGTPKVLWKHMEELNGQYEKTMEQIDNELIIPSEKHTKDWLDRNEHYLEDINNNLKRIQEDLHRVRHNVHLGHLEKDLNRISRSVSERRNDLKRLRDLEKKVVENDPVYQKFRSELEKMRSTLRGRMESSQKMIQWKSYTLRRGHSFHPSAFLDRFPAWQAGWKKRKEDLLIIIKHRG